jgi:hypothetical protein
VDPNHLENHNLEVILFYIISTKAVVFAFKSQTL